MKKKVTNWGNYPVTETNERRFVFKEDLPQKMHLLKHMIARGNGRCYGDASLSESTISTLSSNFILEFDTAQGLFEAQSGLLLSDILEIIVPKGWFLPVTPGTKYVTLGGALASDVHGKNHHVDGLFSDHVISFELMDADGNVVRVDKHQDPDVFQATAGGMGLTGIIVSVRFQLKKIETSYIRQKKIKARDLDEIMDIFEANKAMTYTMAWIDCLQSGSRIGRSIFYGGEHADAGEIRKREKLKTSPKGKIAVPFYLPAFILNRVSIKLFNWLVYAKSFRKEINSFVHYEGFFYPLDAILHWNKMYGKRGFVQYQCVLPLATSREGLREILTRTNQKGWGSFLAVLKLFGKESGLISFPMEGYTLALDFPIRKGLMTFLDELDEIVVKHGGRIYLSKDARMHRKIFEKSYPKLGRFREIIQRVNPDKKFSSMLSQRLME